MNIWLWAGMPVVLAAPVWWVLKERGIVHMCPIRWFAAQSLRTFRRFMETLHSL